MYPVPLQRTELRPAGLRIAPEPMAPSTGAGRRPPHALLTWRAANSAPSRSRRLEGKARGRVLEKGSRKS